MSISVRRFIVQALTKTVVALLFACVTGVTFAAVTGDTTQQADPPVDCKKTPDNPKCRDK
jgi:hypothetical protein